MTLWEWITASTSPDAWIQIFGLGTLAALFATDRILTRGQHTRRTADLQEHHARELKEKDARISDALESRDTWKEAARTERERADKATDSVGEMATAVADVLHVLQSLERALPAPARDGVHDDRA